MIMGRIEELRKELEKELSNERSRKVCEKIRELDRKYKGRCFCSAFFDGKERTLRNMSAKRVIGFIPNNPAFFDNEFDVDADNSENITNLEILCKSETIEYSLSSNKFKFDCSATFDTVLSNACLADTFRYEIQPDVFFKIRDNIIVNVSNVGIHMLDGLADVIKNRVVDKQTHSDEIRKAGGNFVCIDNAEYIMYLSGHPFVYGNYILDSDMSRTILKNMIGRGVNEMEKWSTVRDSDNVMNMCDKKIKALKAVLKIMEGE